MPKIFTLSTVEGGEIVGADEILQGKSARDVSIRVKSTAAFVLFMPERDFLEKILRPFPEIG